jgi:ribosomal-protein-alanine N-acetyltransferase
MPLKARPPHALQTGERVLLRRPCAADQAAFLTAARRSRALHRALVQPPTTAAAFERWLARQQPAQQLHLVCRRDDGALCGVMNVTEIVRGPLRGANLGYYAFAPLAGQGYMREGLELVLRQAFGPLDLHRLEANVQPANAASLALVLRSGFRVEGYSPRFLKIAGRWRDHVRTAIHAEEWRARRKGQRR